MPRLVEGTVWWWLVNNPAMRGLPSRERPGEVASNSEKKRWLEKKSVELNGTKPGPTDPMPDEVVSLVLFPKGRRITLV